MVERDRETTRSDDGSGEKSGDGSDDGSDNEGSGRSEERLSDGNGEDEADAVDRERLQTELAVLREENERLRSAYAAATRTRHRKTALGFAGLGIVALAGGLLLSDAREVLFALGGTGLFAGLLVVFLSPERFVAASVGRDVYGAMADNEDGLATELGLTDDRIYVPTGEGGRVRLFVPQHADYEIPADDELGDVLVVPENETARGLSLRPTGGPLVDEYEQSASSELAADDLASDPEPLARGLAAALVEQFEVVDSVSVEAEPGRVTVAASDGAFGPCDGFDHPVGSVLAVGLARGLDEPVALSVRASEDERADWQLTCRWNPDDE